MSSSVVRASRDFPARLSAVVASLLCATALAGCSADVARLDMASLGYSDLSHRQSVPVPSEPMHRDPVRPAPSAAPATPYSYNPAPYQPSVSRTDPVRQAGLPEPVTSSPPPMRSTGASRAAPLLPAPPALERTTSGPSGGRVVEVAAGDTVYAIARRNGVSIAALMSANGLTNPTIRPGQKLTVPEAGRGQSPGRRHQVAAHRPGTKAPASTPVLEREPHRPAAAAAPSPAPVATAAPSDWSGTYTVTPRDSLYAIAQRHNVRVTDLQAANGITNPARLRAGMVLKVPSGSGGGDPSTAPIASASPAPVPPAVAQEAQARLTPGPSARPTIINAGDDTASAPEPQVPEKVAVATPKTPVLNDVSPPEVAPVKPKSAAAIGKFRWPAKGRIVAGFGPRPDQSHNDGINILVPQGSGVLAAESGTVAYAGSELKGYGNLILIRHEGNWVSAYAHNDTLLVRRGDHVERGQEIAKAGKTGAVDQPQLHFELRQGSKPVDPVPHLER